MQPAKFNNGVHKFINNYDQVKDQFEVGKKLQFQLKVKEHKFTRVVNHCFPIVERMGILSVINARQIAIPITIFKHAYNLKVID